MAGELDVFTDPQIAAIADLLARSLKARLGELIVDAVYTRPPTAAELALDLPALVVMRESDASEADDEMSDNEVITLVVEYYAGPTPVNLLDVRWPLLRNVWKQCHFCLHAGFDPLVLPAFVNVAVPGAPERIVSVLASLGLLVPSRPVGSVKYALAVGEADPVPWFRATVTVRSHAAFDWTLGGTFQHPALAGIDGAVVVSDPESGAPHHTEPGFASTITFE
jgi:hypothetical protein